MGGSFGGLFGYNNWMTSKKEVVYFCDEMVGTYHYAFAHPMKPLRVAMTDEIIRKYELNNHFDHIVHRMRDRIYSLPSCITYTRTKR